MYELKNKVALVSGGGRDIGAEVSKKLASLGAKVCFSYFDDDAKGKQTLKAIKDAGGEIPEVVDRYREKTKVFYFAEYPFETAQRGVSFR